GRPCRGGALRTRVGPRVFRRRARSGHARRQRGSPAPAGHAGGVVDVLEARPGRVRRVHRRAEGGRGAALHAPLVAGAGRGSLPALRHADDRQGRHPAVLTSGGPGTAFAGCSSEREILRLAATFQIDPPTNDPPPPTERYLLEVILQCGINESRFLAMWKPSSHFAARELVKTNPLLLILRPTSLGSKLC